MTPNARLFLGLGVIELGLAVLWIWLAKTAAQSSSDPAAQAVIGQILGGAMGLIFGLGCAIFLIRKFRQKGR